MNDPRLDCPIQLQRATYTTNSLNEKIATWENLGPRIMSERSFKSAGENIKAQQVQATLINRYVFRWAQSISDLNPKDRLVDNGLTYEITQVILPAGTRNEWFEVHAVAKAD